MVNMKIPRLSTDSNLLFAIFSVSKKKALQDLEDKKGQDDVQVYFACNYKERKR